MSECLNKCCVLNLLHHLSACLAICYIYNHRPIISIHPIYLLIDLPMHLHNLAIGTVKNCHHALYVTPEVIPWGVNKVIMIACCSYLLFVADTSMLLMGFTNPHSCQSLTSTVVLKTISPICLMTVSKSFQWITLFVILNLSFLRTLSLLCLWWFVHSGLFLIYLPSTYCDQTSLSLIV